jgi:3-hydroxyacyl-CoA dehydrogenase/3-hydroxy-2-methylbutyryl-CoA dehydrogenase
VKLSDRVAVVTGAGSGMGRASALAFRQGGARVAALDLDGASADATAEALGDGVIGLAVDIAEPVAVEYAFARIDEAFGRVDLCVNAAGNPAPGKIVSRGAMLPLERFRAVIDVNLVGTFDVMRHAAIRMSLNEPDDEGERGVIVNIASGAAWQGQSGQAAYAASKAGIIGMTLPVARDLSPLGIRVVDIAPGLFDTKMLGGLPEETRDALESMVLNPKRLGRAAEIAELVCHIVSNRYLNATTISIDAGARMV